MKAITLWEPWASLVVLDQKRNETRSWYTDYRGPLAIHAAKREASRYVVFDEPVFSALKPRQVTTEVGTGLKFDPGCILGLGNLVDCLYIGSNGLYAYKNKTVGKRVCGLPTGNELAFGDYSEGRFAWKLTEANQLATPIAVKGIQRIWNWDEAEHLVAIDLYSIGSTRIWTPKGVISGRKLDRPDEDAIKGLEVA